MRRCVEVQGDDAARFHEHVFCHVHHGIAVVGIGAGLSLFTRYKKVLNASGSGMKIHDALELIYQEILGYLKEKNADSEADTVQLKEE